MGSKQTLPNKGPEQRSPAGPGFLNHSTTEVHTHNGASQENLSFVLLEYPKLFCALFGGEGVTFRPASTFQPTFRTVYHQRDIDPSTILPPLQWDRLTNHDEANERSM